MRANHDVADIVEILDQSKSAHDGPGAVLRDTLPPTFELLAITARITMLRGMP